MSLEEKIALAFDPETPVDVLVRLAADESHEVRMNTVMNPSLPSEVRAKLAKEDETVGVRIQATKHNNWSLEEFEQLVQTPGVMIKTAISANVNTPASILKLLVDETNESILQGLAGNPNTPEEWLGKYNTPKYRRYLAANPKAPVYLLEELASDDDYMVRHTVAEHKNTPAQTLEQIAEDNDEYYMVVYSAITNPNMLLPNIEKLANSKNITTRALTARSPHATPQLLYKLSKDKEVRVRAEVMISKNVTPGIMLSFLRDEDSEIREDVKAYIEAWEDQLFYEGIEELGYSHLNFLPRNWIVKAIS